MRPPTHQQAEGVARLVRALPQGALVCWSRGKCFPRNNSLRGPDTSKFPVVSAIPRG